MKKNRANAKAVISSGFGGVYREATFFSLDHAEEVYAEAKEINDSAWDCKLIEIMKQKGSTLINPIYHWTTSDIWEYIHNEHICMNPLYGCGYDRVGCIGCPLANYRTRMKEFADYPKYKQAYTQAFEKMLVQRKKRGFKCEWRTGEEVFNWWIEEYKHNVKGQMTLDDFMEGEKE